MSAVRLSFLQVTNSEVITAHSNAWHTRIAMSLHAHTHAHTLAPRHTWLNLADGRTSSLTYTHMLAVNEQTHRMFTQTPTTHSVCTFTHVTQTHTCICPHTHCLEDVRTPFLLSSQSHWHRHAYTHTHTQLRHDEKWQDMSERPMTASLISSHSIFSPDLFLCHRFISRISTQVLEFICRWNMIPAFIQMLWSRGMTARGQKFKTFNKPI